MTPNYNRNLHRRAREKWLERLYAKHNSLCHWCKSATAMRRFVEPASLISATNGFLTWRDGDVVLRARLATVDHVTPISEGGTNDATNVVLACADCNQNRTRTKSPKPEIIRRQCPKCFKEKPERKSMCHECFFTTSVSWLESHGWTMVTTEDGFRRFVDPLTGEVHMILRIACRVQRARVAEKEPVPA